VVQLAMKMVRPAVPKIEALDRCSPLPLYVQIRRRLHGLIARWDGAKDRFYSEDELCRLFGVSRMTVRQAVQDLVDDGSLRRVKGLGTFVVRRKLEERPLASFFDRTGTDDTPMTIDVLEFETIRAGDSAPDLGPGERIRSIKRLRSWGTVPVAVDYRYIPAGIAKDLRQDYVKRQSLVDYLAGLVQLHHVDMQLEATVCGNEEARLLKLVPGDPILVRHLRYVTAEGRAVMTGRSLYRADLVRYAFSVPLEPGERGIVSAAATHAQGEGEI
jgi:GntR family transcriptional regulator, N-acetylglucosamine utilization regulator